jgi:hypothetical protein
MDKDCYSGLYPCVFLTGYTGGDYKKLRLLVDSIPGEIVDLNFLLLCRYIAGLTIKLLMYHAQSPHLLASMVRRSNQGSTLNPFKSNPSPVFMQFLEFFQGVIA